MKNKHSYKTAVKLFFLMMSVQFIACFKIADGPKDVNWKGRVLNAITEQPIAGQEVGLRKNRYSNNDPFFGHRIREDIFKTDVTDSLGRFEFQYRDPDDRGWYTVETSHPDYFKGEAAAGGFYTNPVKNTRIDILFQPKAWLKIRVLDDPAKDSGRNGVVFRGVYDLRGFKSTNIIFPSMGDTTFIGYIEGGKEVFFEYQADSTGYLKYEAVFPPFDTTELTFTY